MRVRAISIFPFEVLARIRCDWCSWPRKYEFIESEVDAAMQPRRGRHFRNLVVGHPSVPRWRLDSSICATSEFSSVALLRNSAEATVTEFRLSGSNASVT